MAGSIDAFRKAIDADPRNEGVYLELAPRMIGVGRIEALVPILFAAERELPQSAAILTRLRTALILTGRHAEAVEAAHRRLALGADALCDLGVARFQLQRFPEAVEALEEAVTIDEGLPNAFWDDSGKAARYSIELTPERLEPKMVLHTVLEGQNRHREAQWVMSGAARLHPALAAELENLGDLRLKEGDRARALDYWDKALGQTSDEASKARLRQKIAGE